MKKAWLCLGVLAFIVTGCGHKGPLYLPQPQKPSPQTAPAPGTKPTPDGTTPNP